MTNVSHGLKLWAIPFPVCRHIAECACEFPSLFALRLEYFGRVHGVKARCVISGVGVTYATN